MKILDISANPFSRYLNNGKTSETIYAAFDKSEICQLFTRPNNTKLLDFDFCSSYYCVTDFDVVNKLILKTMKCGGEVDIKKTEYINEDEKYNKINNSNLSYYKKELHYIRDILWNTNVWRTKNLSEWIERQNPDAIFIHASGDCYLLKIALYIQKQINVPMIYHVGDDYILSVHSNGLLEKWKHRKLNSLLKAIMLKSKANYAISDALAKAYSDYFKVPFDCLMNSVDILPYRTQEEINNPIIISYFGSLSLNRDKMIMKLASTVKGKAIVRVYSFGLSKNSDVYKKLNDVGIIIMDGVKDTALDDAMYASDVLLHVESDDEVTRSFTKLAISTKIPEYLVHCRPILGYGPQEVASMRLLADNQIGFATDSQDNESLMLAINALSDLEVRQKFIKKGYEYVCEKFNKEKNARNFRNKVLNILNYDRTI